MRKILSIMFLFALLASSCSQDELIKSQSTSSTSKLFTASFEQNESRTYIENGNLLRWTEGDQISLFDGNTLNRQFQFDGETGDNAGTFSVVDKPNGTGNDLSANYAVYPYAKDFKITENGVITATLPAEQSYATNSFGLGANTMVAVTEDTDDTFLKFKNVCGYLKLQLYGNDVTVKSITVTGNNNDKLAGNATIMPVYGGNPTISMADDATETITLDCGENGVKIGSTAETATAFWMVVPPTTFEKGFTVTVSDIEERTFTQSTSKKVVIERNVINPMAALEVQPQNNIPYLTFTADAAQTLTMTQAVSTLEYSVNGGTWTELGTNTITFGGENGKLQLRGKNLNGTATDAYNSFSSIKFGNAVPVACTGDIRTLLDGEKYATINTENARFCRLFENCSNLISAPKLPATKLASECYESMFENCASLIKAPELPATHLTSSCYSDMFRGCTSLKKAPQLPATYLSSGCYSCMFLCCTSLIEAPELPATTMENGCYYFMFMDCTNLTKAPKLPATQLASMCYDNMFLNCRSLIEAPELPATKMEDWCYLGMFAGCTSLTKAPKLPATQLASMCYDSMFTGCTNLTETPELPATSLESSCYSYMFKDCTNLTTAPELPAINLAGSCYQGMFSNCASLAEVPKLPATILAKYCYNSMFKDCTNLTTAPELPATSLTKRCYYEMFAGCTNLTTAPELPATHLEEECYYSMFDGCSQLNNITMLATDVSANSCLTYWLYGVSSTGTFIKSTNMPSLPAGASGIPPGWTIVNYEETDKTPYLTFTANKAQTLTIPQPIKTLEYSVNGSDWAELSTITVTFGGEHGKLQLRGKSLNGTATSSYSYATIRFGNETPVACTGDIRTLLDYENYKTVDTSKAKFCNLFKECTCLTEAPKLPATKLAENCYKGMFANCTSLINAPELPATALADYCYSFMFYACTSLKKAPELPATILTLDCYSYMFYACNSLTKSPELPAIVLADYCYYNMFFWCSKLNNVTMLATDISASGCLSGWLDGVSSTGTFTKAKEMTSLPVGEHGIPSGWTVKNYGE